jgi:23S rRNA (adenine2503-C2)-methyltransferase
MRVKPALALSLHTTRAALRAALLPRAPRIDPAELVELGEPGRAPPATRSSTSGR